MTLSGCLREPFVAPFALPPGRVVELHLPFPPSTNKLWRKTKRGVGMMLSEEYVRWKDQADKVARQTAACRGLKTITGKFEARIILRRFVHNFKGHQGDIDNRIKAVLDAAQRFELIADDKHCERLVVEWGDDNLAPHGCKLILKELP